MINIGMYTDVMDVRELAAYLSRDYAKLQQDYQKLGVPTLRVGGRIYFIKAEVDVWLAAQRSAATEFELRQSAALATLDNTKFRRNGTR